jgi:hypothetical protein
MTMARPARKITAAAPGTELAAETAAAMAAASILFKTADPSTYSRSPLMRSRLMYAYCDRIFWVTFDGHYSDYNVKIRLLSLG